MFSSTLLFFLCGPVRFHKKLAVNVLLFPIYSGQILYDLTRDRNVMDVGACPLIVVSLSSQR